MANEAHTPWVEKYRPSTVDQMVGNEEATSRLQAIADEGNTPNLIFAGPPGTGKTTGVMCLARSLLGDAMGEGVLELNASDDRGIDVVRNKIKMFAQKKLNLPHGKHKLVFLDEADSMTAAAQQAMRRTMEIYSNTTRFVLACNQSEKIIEPIQSRCAIVRFTRLSDEQITARLKHVVDSEAVAYSPDGLAAIVFTADGDMRQAINNLQSTQSGFGYIEPESVYKVCDQPHPKTAARALDACKVGDIDSAHAEIKSLWDYGYSAIDVVGTLFRVCKSAELPEHLKLEFSKQIGFCHMRAGEGVNSMLQLDGLLAKLCRTATAAGANAQTS